MPSVNSNEIQGIWRALSGAVTTPGWQTIDLLKAGSCQMKLARHSPSNEEAALVGFASTRIAPASRLPKGQGFRMERANLGEALDSYQWLAIVRQPSGPLDLFAAVVCDLAGLLSCTGDMTESQLYQNLLARVRGWQEFMRKGRDGLSTEAEQGLVGELCLLRSLIEEGVFPISAIDAWKGPQDGLHDFLFGAGSIEVKSTIAIEGFPISIASLDQLDDSQSSPLYLAGVRLEVNDTGMTLPELVGSFRTILKLDSAALHKFELNLIDAGYLDMHRDTYIRRFTLQELKILLVNSDFPRLIHANVPAAVRWATYQLDISIMTTEPLPLSGVLQKLGVA
ncbi:hypothetical protein D3C77_112570 [compost metagenome]